MAVFVLGKDGKPLMPCSEKRARLLLAKNRAVVKRVKPFVIQLKDRDQTNCELQDLEVKIDPGSKFTGICLSRTENRVVNVLNLFELEHRGQLISRKLINENQVIGVEKLKVKNMVKNHKLSKAISSASWSRFCEMLNYKSRESQNCSIVYMDTYFPSTHICNTTGLKLDYKLKLSDRTWKCPHCNETHDRDLNAARNIRDESLTTLALHKIPDGAGIVVLAARQ